MWHVRKAKEVQRGFLWENLGKEKLGRSRGRWEDNIKMDLQEVGWEHGLGKTGL